jgi:hypothetical protein
MEALSYVKFGDKDGLGEFLFENGVQHQLFYEILGDNGCSTVTGMWKKISMTGLVFTRPFINR